MAHRIPYPDPDTLTPEQQAVADAVASGPRGEIRGPMRLMLHSPDLAARVQQTGEFLRWKTSLEPRLTELAIMVTARGCNCHYVWRNHLKVARENGVGDAVLEAVANRRTPVLEREDERLVYDMVQQMLATATMTEATVAAARKEFGDRGIVELAALVGHYQMGAYVLNAARVPLVDGGFTILPD